MTTNTMVKLKKPIEQLNPPWQHMDFEKGSPQASHLKRETIHNGNKTTHVCQCVGTHSAGWCTKGVFFPQWWLGGLYQIFEKNVSSSFNFI
jgi:hypothetical protein